MVTRLPRIGRQLAAAAALLLALGGAPALAARHGGHGGGFHGRGFRGGFHGRWHGGHFHGPHVFIDGGFFFGPPYFYAPFFYDYYPYPPYFPPPPPPPPPPPDQEEQEDAPEPPASYGLVQLRGVPDGAAVDLDGRFWLTAARLDERWLGLPEGTHTITVRRAGRDTVSRQVDVSAGSTQVVDFGSPY
jgi:hypothetical protein